MKKAKIRDSSKLNFSHICLLYAIPAMLTALYSLTAATPNNSKIADFSFVQISDSHIGFNRDPNKNPDETLKKIIEKINAMPNPPDFVIHTGDLTDLSTKGEFDSLDMLLKTIHTSKIYYVPGEHDVILDSGKLFFSRYAKGAQKGGWYSFDHKGVHYVALVNVVNRTSSGSGHLGSTQLSWVRTDLRRLQSSTPVVIFTHIPLWNVYVPWGWNTDDADSLYPELKRFSHVTVLNGHIHQLQRTVMGTATFQTTRGTAYPLPAPGTAAAPAPLVVPANQLPFDIGFRRVDFKAATDSMLITDNTLGESSAPPAAKNDPQIEITNFAFSPAQLTITVGTTVVWVNHDSEAHTVMSTDNSFTKSPALLTTNQTFSYKFTKPGTYNYICTIHPNMKGQIVVK